MALGLGILGIHHHGAFPDRDVINSVVLEQHHGIFDDPRRCDHAPFGKGHCPGPKDNIWLEEYALLPPPHVLNGFITILFGIHEFHKVTGNKKALTLWNEGIKTIKTNLEKYEAGHWSIYDLLRKYPSTNNYHKLHIWQLKTLYELTNEKMFLDYSKKWEKYNNKLFNKKYAGFQRGLLYLKRYGFIDSYNRYVKRKKWNRK